jgi:hypothetical protein
MDRAHRPLSWSALLLALVGAVGCGDVARAAVADDGHRRYHDGQRWIEVEVALDRFAIETAAGSSSGERTPDPLRLAEPVAFVADLEVSAQEYLARNPDVVQVYACIYPLGADRGKTPAMRLTRRLALTGAPGQDLAALAAKHGARVVEKADYRPDTVICEAIGPSLLAALEAANALREEPGVVAATPLIARQHQPRSR